MRRSPSSALAAAAVLAACGAARPAPSDRATPRCAPATRAVVAGPDDAAALAGCAALGALTIRTAGPLELAALRDLTALAGDLVIGPSVGLAEVALPGLRAVGGGIRVVANGDLHGVLLPQLERAGRISVEGNAALGRLQLPRLREVTGALAVIENAELALVELGALEAVGGELAVTGNPRLVLVEAARLARAGAVRIDANPLLPDDAAAALRATIWTP